MVSVIILSQDKPSMVLNYLEQQTYQDFEVIIASEKGIVTAMNNALQKAKGEILVRIDDDVALPACWLEELVISFSDPKIAGVTGPTYVPYKYRGNRDSIRIVEHPNWFLRWLFDNDPYAPAKIYKCGSVSYGSNFMEHIDKTEKYEIDHLEGTNWAMRTELIRQVGGFDPMFNGVAEWYDTDVVCKIKKLGYTLKYNPRAYLLHILTKGNHYQERYAGFGRIKNWLRFHWRHSKFHPKMIVWLFLMMGYYICLRFRR